MKILSLIVLADIIKSQRTKKNITQEQLYEQSGINRNMIGRIERMDYIPTIPQLLESRTQLLQPYLLQQSIQ